MWCLNIIIIFYLLLIFLPRFLYTKVTSTVIRVWVSGKNTTVGVHMFWSVDSLKEGQVEEREISDVDGEEVVMEDPDKGLREKQDR